MSAAEGLTTILKPENILVALPDESRSGVVKALIANLVDTKRIAKKHVETAAQLIAKREAQGSTALGSGLAIPHARVTFPAPVIAFALIANGAAADYKSLDREAVKFVFLLLTPDCDENEDEDEREAANNCHQSILKAIITFCQNPVHRRALSGCRTVKDVWDVFVDYSPK